MIRDDTGDWVGVELNGKVAGLHLCVSASTEVFADKVVSGTLPTSEKSSLHRTPILFDISVDGILHLGPKLRWLWVRDRFDQSPFFSFFFLESLDECSKLRSPGAILRSVWVSASPLGVLCLEGPRKMVRLLLLASLQDHQNNGNSQKK